MMRHLGIGLALTPLICGLARGAAADEEYDALFKEFQEAQQRWFEEYGKLAKESEGGEVDESRLPPRPEPQFQPRFRAYAEKHAGQPEAIAALVWLIRADEPTDRGKPGTDAKWALEQLTEHHAAQPALGEHVGQLRYLTYAFGAEPLITLFEKVRRTNPDAEAQAGATFNLAVICYGREPDSDQPRDLRRARELFTEVVEKWKESKVAEQARGYLFELDHLQIGMKAPEIVGQDAEGREIRLSQFRGQVVVLDFWGFW